VTGENCFDDGFLVVVRAKRVNPPPVKLSSLPNPTNKARDPVTGGRNLRLSVLCTQGPKPCPFLFPATVIVIFQAWTARWCAREWRAWDGTKERLMRVRVDIFYYSKYLMIVVTNTIREYEAGVIFYYCFNSKTQHKLATRINTTSDKKWG
jgi:hypothetical protein